MPFIIRYPDDLATCDKLKHVTICLDLTFTVNGCLVGERVDSQAIGSHLDAAGIILIWHEIHLPVTV